MKEGTMKALGARSCYGHLGGTLGDRLFARLVELEWFEKVEGKSTVYALTEKGIEEMTRLGVDVREKRRTK